MAKNLALPLSMAQEATANRLATAGRKLDIGTKQMSYGKQTNTTNMIDEAPKAVQLAWTIQNTTATKHSILFSTHFTDTKSGNQTIFENVTEILAATGASAVFREGQVILVVGPPDTEVKISTDDAKRSITQFLRYAGLNPLRFTKFLITSRKISNGEKDSSNYSNKIKSFWFSPFDDPESKELPLRPIVQGGNNFNPDMLTVDFIEHNFEAILSSEHFLQFQINPDTELSITAYIGAQDSKSQRFYRFVREADDLLRPERIRLAK